MANYITCRGTDLEFGEPEPILEKTDSEAIRNLILSLTTAEARKRGIEKNTLWHLQERAREHKTFKIYGKVERKLSQTQKHTPVL